MAPPALADRRAVPVVIVFVSEVAKVVQGNKYYVPGIRRLVSRRRRIKSPDGDSSEDSPDRDVRQRQQSRDRCRRPRR